MSIMPILGVLVTLLLGCSTPYKSYSWGAGYRDRALGDGAHFINVEVSAYTDRGTAHEFFYRRAAELCAPQSFEVLELSEGSSATAIISSGASATVLNSPSVSGRIRCARSEGRHP